MRRPRLTIAHPLLSTLLVVLLTACGSDPPPEAQTAARRVLTAWLTAFNSGDPNQVRTFDETYGRKDAPLERVLDLRKRTGGFTLLRIEEDAPLSIIALLQEKDSDTVARIELSLDAGESPTIASLALRRVPRPPDLAIPRMTKADALAALSRCAEELTKEDKFSGALLVAQHGKILRQEAWGRADREAGTPVTLDTRFRIGSMNKMFTAIATLQLAEAGQLALDDPIGKHLPKYPNKDVASKVTVRHLLTHTGGTGDIFGPAFTRYRLTLRAHRDYVKLYGARGLTHEPGVEQRYSNYGYVLLGTLIEQMSGMSYYKYVRTKVFQPAGMTSTGSLPETQAVPHRATGYMKRGGVWVSNAHTLPWRGTAAGGGYSTVRDLFRFAQALEAGKLISRMMLADASRAQEREYGYGFVVQGEGMARSYGHGGGASGMNGDLRVFPGLGYVLVGLSNLDPPAASRLVEFFALRMPMTR